MIAISLLSFLSCDRTETESVYVVDGYFIAGSQNAEVSVKKYDGEEEKTVDDASVSLKINGETYDLGYTGNGRYQATLTGVLSSPDTPVTLEIRVDKRMGATVRIPPDAPILSHSGQVFPVDPQASGAGVFQMTWTKSPGYSYLLRLECLETEPVQIPFPDSPTPFRFQYPTPLEEATITLYAGDFEYYGMHKLTIYVIDEVYRDLFFYRNNGLSIPAVQGPDNVSGGTGVWTAVNSEEIIVTLVQ